MRDNPSPAYNPYVGFDKKVPLIKKTLHEEAERYNNLQEKAKTFIPEFLNKKGITGQTLAILHHTHGFDFETSIEFIPNCSIKIPLENELREGYDYWMEHEQALSRSKMKKEVISAL